MKRIAELTIKFRVFIIIITALITLGLGYFIKNLRVNSDVMSYLPDDDPVSAIFEEVGVRFGGNQTVVIGFRSDDVFSYESLCKIRDITDSVENCQGVRSAISLTNIIDISEIDSVLTVTQLIDPYEIPDDKAKLDSIRQYTLSKDFYKGFILSEDCKLTIIAVKIEKEYTEISDTNLTGNELLRYYRTKYPTDLYEVKITGDTVHAEVIDATVTNNIKQKLIKDFPGTEFHFGGLSFMTEEVGDIILRDMSFLGPIALLFILFALFLGFRNFRGVIMPITTVLLAIIWTLGLMDIFGFEISLVSNVTPIILLAIGSAYTLHVVSRIHLELYKEGTYLESLKKAMSYIIIPVFLAAITTMIGFLSFIYGSYLTMIRDFGFLTALGVVFSLLLSISFAPAVLSYFPMKPKSHEESKKGVIHIMLTFFYNKTRQNYKWVLAIWIVVCGIMIWGASGIERRVDLLDYFKKDHPSRISEELLRESFGGTIPVYVQVKGNVQTPEVLNKMKDIENFLKSQSVVTHVQSVATLIEEMNDIMGEGEVVPQDEAKIQNLWFLLDGQEVMDQLVTPGLDYGLVQGVLKTSDSRLMAALVDSLQTFIDSMPANDGIPVLQAGFPSIYKKLDESIMSSQVQSLLIAILLCFVFVSILIRSAGKGLLTTMPIIVTLFVLFGFMGWSGVPLDIATVLVASVSIGIGVDYGIHFTTLYSHELKSGKSLMESINLAYMGSGKSIVINVFSVTAGFLVLLFSDLVPLQRFGASIAITMITSGLATLTFLPAVIIVIDNIKRKFKKQKIN